MSAERSPTALRRLLIVRTDRLGETLLTLPAVAAARAACPGVSVAFLVHPDLEPLLAGAPGIDTVLLYDRAWRGAWWRRAIRLAGVLRELEFDAAVVFNPMKEFHLAVRLARIPRRVGYTRKWGWCLTCRVPDRKALGERHEVEYNLDLVGALLDAAPPPPTPQRLLPALAREQEEVQALLEAQGLPAAEPFAVVHPGSSNPVKQWPAARYRSLVEALAARMAVVLTGGTGECSLVREACPPGTPRVVDLAGRLTLRHLAALLERARVLVANDSGPVHLAAAVGTPALALFGTPDPAMGPRRWGPWGAGHTVIWKPTMDAISVDDVMDAARQMLDRVTP